MGAVVDGRVFQDHGEIAKHVVVADKIVVDLEIREPQTDRHLAIEQGLFDPDDFAMQIGDGFDVAVVVVTHVSAVARPRAFTLANLVGAAKWTDGEPP